MAKFRISEYPSANVESPDAVPYPAIVVQPLIDFSDNAVHTSQPFSGDTRAIRVSTDADVCYLIGPSPVASLDNDLLPGEKYESRWVRPGDSVSIIAAGTGGGGGGSLTLTDGTHTVTGVTMITGDNLTVSGTTPNATLQVGGPTNTITGFDAACLGASNHATGDYSVTFGISNTSSGFGAISFGAGNNATNTGSVAFGSGNNSSANGSIAFGQGCVASGLGSIVSGYLGADRGVDGVNSFGGGTFSGAAGDIQSVTYNLNNVTRDATPTVLFTPNGNQVVLPDNGVYECHVIVNGKVPGSMDYFSTEIDVIIGRGVGAATTAILTTVPATPVVTDLHTTVGTAATWSAAVSADTTNGALAVTVTGAVATTIYWECFVNTWEIVA